MIQGIAGCQLVPFLGEGRQHTKFAFVKYPQVEYLREDAFLGAGYALSVKIPAFLICNHALYCERILHGLDLKIQHFKEMEIIHGYSVLSLRWKGIRYYSEKK